MQIENIFINNAEFCTNFHYKEQKRYKFSLQKAKSASDFRTTRPQHLQSRPLRYGLLEEPRKHPARSHQESQVEEEPEEPRRGQRQAVIGVRTGQVRTKEGSCIKDDVQKSPSP